MPDNPTSSRLRASAALLAIATVVAALWIGSVSTHVEVADGSLECRAILAPVDGRALVEASDASIPAYLDTATNLDVAGLESTLMAAVAGSSRQSLCIEARQGQLGWMTLVAVLGAAAALGAAVTARSRGERNPVAPPQDDAAPAAATTPSPKARDGRD